jgi:CDP-6-deoxy-D-xylo-4-hexulose-3-dehydrase
LQTVNYPLATTTWDDGEYAAMQRVIDGGRFTMGHYVAEFEAAFAQFHDRQFAVMVNSGSSANLLMVAALFYIKTNALQAGDEVIVPAVSWSTTYAPLSQYGLKVRLVDIDLDTMNFDLEQLAAAITPKTKLIFAVNLLGNPNDFAAIQKLIADKNIMLIEDNCESLGADIDGVKTGCFGAMASFSTFFSHHISTMEGGVILTDDEELYHILLCLRAHGWTRQLPEKNLLTGTKSRDPFEESFRFVLPGYNVRPLELSGAIGLEQLKKLPDIINGRQKNARFFTDTMDNHPLLSIQKEIGNSSWFGFSLVIRPDCGFTRNELRLFLDKNGVEYRPIVAGNFAEQAMIKHMDVEPVGTLPNASYVQTNGLFIGNHHYDITGALAFLKQL